MINTRYTNKNILITLRGQYFGVRDGEKNKNVFEKFISHLKMSNWLLF